MSRFKESSTTPNGTRTRNLKALPTGKGHADQRRSPRRKEAWQPGGTSGIAFLHRLHRGDSRCRSAKGVGNRAELIALIPN